MTASVLQEFSNINSGSASESTISGTFANSCTPGSVIHLIGIVNNTGWAGVIGGASDSVNTYSKLGVAQASNYAMAHFWAANESMLALTLELVLGFTTTQWLLIGREIGGVSQAIDVSGQTFNNSTPTTTNGLSVSVTSSGAPNFASAAGWAYSTGCAAGTSWTAGQTNLQGPVLGGRATTESLRSTVSGMGSAPFTNSTAGRQGLVCVAVFDELMQSLTASPGAFVFTGFAATLTLAGSIGNYIMLAAPGAFVTDGAQAYSAFQLDSAEGAFAFTGEPAGLTASYNLAAQPGAFNLTGEPASFNTGYNLSASPGAFAFTGEPATLTQSSISPSPVLIAGGPAFYGDRVTYDPLILGESVVLPTDFISKLQANETINSATATVTVYSGVDPNPGDLIAGSCTISGSVVNTLVAGGVLGCIYEVKITALTSLPQTINLAGYLAIVPDLP